MRVRRIILVGLKADLRDDFVVTMDEINMLAEQKNVLYAEVSTKDQTGIDEFLETVVECRRRDVDSE